MAAIKGVICTPSLGRTITTADPMMAIRVALELKEYVEDDVDGA